MLLVLIIGFLVVMSLIALSQRFFTSQVTSHTARIGLGIQTSSLAHSAAAEVRILFGQLANDPQHPLFARIREPVFSPELGDLDITEHFELTEFAKLLEEDEYTRFYLDDDFSVKIQFQRQFENLPYERYGLLVIRTMVGYNLSFTESIQQGVEIGHGFRIHLATAPRPFDQPTFMSYLDNPTLDLKTEKVGEAYRLYLSKVRDILGTARIQKESIETPPGVGERYDAVADVLEEPAYWNRFVKEFPTGPSVIFARKKDGEEIDLETLDLESEIVDADALYLEPKREALRLASAMLARDPRDIGAHDKMVEALVGMSAGLTEIMNKFKSFYDDWKFWTGEDAEALDVFRYKLGLAHWQRKAHFIIRPPDPRAEVPLLRISPEDQLRHLLSSTTPMNAVILVDLRERNHRNRIHRVFQLDGSVPEFRHIPGRVTLVFNGPVVIRNINAEEQPEDLLTLIGLHREMTLEGTINAAILVGHNQCSLTIRPDTRIHGLVVTENLPRQGERSAIITRAEKYYSGFTTEDDDSNEFRDFYSVALNIGPAYEKVIR